MKTMRVIGSLLLLTTIGNMAVAQTEAIDKKTKIEFKASANYNTGLNYYGRVDSLKSSGFFPLAELWVNESFYINAAPVFVNNAATSFEYAGTIATVGYQFKANDKWLGNIYVLKPLYTEEAKLVQSALKAQTGATLTWLNKAINITAGADMKFSDKTDYGIAAGIDHIFKKQVNDKSVLVVDPSFYLNAGTQQFSTSYLKRTSGFLFFPGSEQVVTESTKAFNILSYEASLPVIFASGKIQLLFTPAYVIPQNLITVEGRPDLSEKGENMFYATIGAKMSF